MKGDFSRDFNLHFNFLMKDYVANHTTVRKIGSQPLT